MTGYYEEQIITTQHQINMTHNDYTELMKGCTIWVRIKNINVAIEVRCKTVE